jgi:hypothetical protein
MSFVHRLTIDLQGGNPVAKSGTNQGNGRVSERNRRPEVESLEGRQLLSTASAEVRSLYESILGRLPDSAGQAAAVQAISNGQQPSTLAAGLMRSTEYLQKLVVTDYNSDLLRAPTPTEINAGVAALQVGQSNLQLSTNLIASPEFNIRHPDNLDFVDDVYEDILGRRASVSEIANISAQLSNGLSRQAVIDNLAGSREEQILSVVNLYENFLGRVPDTASQIQAVQGLQNGTLKSQDLLNLILNSPEFTAHAIVVGQ